MKRYYGMQDITLGWPLAGVVLLVSAALFVAMIPEIIDAWLTKKMDEVFSGL